MTKMNFKFPGQVSFEMLRNLAKLSIVNMKIFHVSYISFSIIVDIKCIIFMYPDLMGFHTTDHSIS